ncbi:hypothetical protein CP985_09080 [Malaciobacter mytili LMG 24559]|uniref:Phage tail collar domain-containing protein n=1 Tax=Malaciobacter mytili LMG 24559 TaxID=1032238 RepID=A0AAX2AGN0_9BACT|nr:tail fiber protein [Malaciobacter mytili]AXH14254.1 phage tail collar protein [Malaciobacter mytili LMG 24559]RXK15304.1 hypothetical protein CP985_09080 [Malaciobacter mytili LMG 24559]
MPTNEIDVVENLVDSVRLLLSSDTSLESLKEIELCVKQNRVDVESIEVSKIIGLEELLASKLNIADIVDDLLSTLANVPLSANQGRVLNEKLVILNEAIEAIKVVLASDDTTLDELQEIVNFIKQNKSELQNLDLSNIAETLDLKHFTAELKAKLESLPLKEELKTFAVPTGMILISPSSIIPSGFLECNGTELSRTQYAELFAVIGTTYGVGDDITTFNLPDLRGEFIRGFDNGRGIDSGRVIGSWQKASAQIVDPSLNAIYATGITNADNNTSEINDRAGLDTVSASDYNIVAGYSNAIGVGNFNLGGTRPRNIAMIYCIKY